MRLVRLLLLLSLVCVPVVCQEHSLDEEVAEHTEAGPDLTLWKVANFLILVGLGGYFIAKNAGAFFGGRTLEIRRGIDEAQKMKSDAEARSAEMDRKLASLGADIEALRKEAKAEAATEGERIRRDMERETERIRASAVQEIESATKSAQESLRRHAAGLAVEMARGKIESRITASDQDALLDSFLGGLEKTNASLRSSN